MKLLIIFLFLVASVNIAYSQVPICEENMIYSECGSTCPPSCENPNPGPCKPVCVRGCFCKPGLVLNYRGKCVPPNQCIVLPHKALCGENSTYSPCGTMCPPTCDNPNPQMCAAICVVGCFCNPGYLLNDKKSCVLPFQC